MEPQQQRLWQESIDQAESPSGDLLPNLPEEGTLGQVFVESKENLPDRKWLYCEILTGSIGARWAYWMGWIDPITNRLGLGPNPKHVVIVDRIFNGDAPHFVGMLASPFAGRKHQGQQVCEWVLVEPKVIPPNPVPVREIRDRERYEKSKIIYDVETGETKEI